MKRLVVVDGFSLAFRAFFAIPFETMHNSSGLRTNALYGLVSMLDGLLENWKPSHMAVALDLPEPTFRDELNPNYKGHRPPTHEALVEQLELLSLAIGSLGIAVVSKSGFEADDILATLSNLGKGASIETILVTGDRDSYQLVEDPFVKVLYNRRGVSDYLLLDEAGVMEKVGATPKNYPLLAALRGDPSDNLMGVTGVGDKTAAKLATTYGTLDSLLSNLDALTPKISRAIEAGVDNLRLNLELTHLRGDLDLSLSLADLELGPLDDSKAKEFFDLIESKKLYSRTLGAFDYIGHLSSGHDNTNEPTVEIRDVTREEFFKDIGSSQNDFAVGIDVTYTGEAGRSSIDVIWLAKREGPAQIATTKVALEYQDERLCLETLIRDLGDLSLVGFGLKEFLRRLFTIGLTSPKIGADLGLSAYLLDSSLGDYDPFSVLEAFTPEVVGSIRQVEGGSGDLIPDLFSTLKDDVSSMQIASMAALADLEIRRLIEADKSDWLLDAIENPLLVVLAKMEAVGVLVDRGYLSDLKDDFIRQARQLSNQIQSMARRTFNVNSTKQLGSVLFEDLGLTPPKKTKTGFSTDASTLEKLVGIHPIIELIIRYREVEKLRSTYGESLLAEVGGDDRIHATFNQMVARTGRLSSDHPNLHNIPIRSEEGKKFRFAFVAPQATKLIVADYSQIELRVIAHLSGDPGLVEAFSLGTDIHTELASRVFGIPSSQVTSAQRSKAKMVAYGLAYGMEAYGLATRLNIDVGEADSILQSFFGAFPKLRQYMDSVVKEAVKNGFTETQFGRKRRIPDLSNPNGRLRQGAERQAMNSVIQGLAADIFKLAIVNLDTSLDPENARLILQVHDEVLVEVRTPVAQEVADVVVDVMENAASLKVPLMVNSYIVDKWGDSK
ncbi:DNA polymerase I [Acidithrix sp. C25]|uniref:DNA polymerase I n=1 Tax=Acidithrix sp. C25 TaxID=1671482 RepID=UPI00191BC19D|nr:DNA polymerase I [Acidithrix sp. C25]CAG4923388.1 unnamed protein product [Acidithrix sp. C25]